MVDVLYSGAAQDRVKFPYIVLSKISNTLDTLSTCFTRLENNLFQIGIFSDNYEDLLRRVDEVENLLEGADFQIGNRLFTTIEFVNKSIDEPVSGVYQAFLVVEIIVEKNLAIITSVSGIDWDSLTVDEWAELTVDEWATLLVAEAASFGRETSGKTFFEALYKRFVEHTPLSSAVAGFSTTSLVLEEWKRPFIYIPDYQTVEFFTTTCSRLQTTTFSITVQGHNPEDIEVLMEEIDNLYNYATLIIDNRRFTALEWIGDSLIEIDQEIWEGSVNFELALEKDIA